MVSVIAVNDRRQLKEFVELPYTMYATDPHFVPQLRRDEYRRFEPRHNPFLDHARMTLWLASDNGRTVGRLAAIDDRLHNEVHHEAVTWFGFFEACDAAVGKALLAAVEGHARLQGSRSVRGPVNPSLHEAAGLLVDGFDSAPVALMPYNPPQYESFIEGAGYRKAKDLLAWELDLRDPPPDRIVRLAERVRKRFDIKVRRVDLRKFDQELDILKVIYRSAWEDNWGFVPPTDAEIRQLAVDLRPVVDPELVLFAEMDGQPVACAVTIPDVNQVLRKMNGGLFPFGIVHFLRRASIITRVRMLMLGVLPKYRRLGLYPLLIAEARQRTVRRGYTSAEVGWTLEDNELVNSGIQAAGGRHYKTYRLYEKAVG
jgi:GNAT superfamily N-acetyltransferase